MNEMATKTETETNGTATAERKPADQALQVVDVAVGAAPVAVENARKTVDQFRDADKRSQEIELLQNRVKNLRDSNTRSAQLETFKQQFTGSVEKAEKKGAEVRKSVSDQVVDRARKARERVEPVVDRVEPVYKKRVEPTVKRVRERI